MTWFKSIRLPWLARAQKHQILVCVDLVQDIDVLLPVCIALRAAGPFTLRFVVSHWLTEKSPRTALLLTENGFEFSYASRRKLIDGVLPPLGRAAAVLTASESTHSAHSACRTLTQRARTAGLRTYVLQHGLENIGLFGVEAKAATFASDTVFCWYPEDATPPDPPAETRSKLVHAGRPEPVGGWGRGEHPDFDLGIFENLHWTRYTDAERVAFQDCLAVTAEALPETRILVRPHPAGAWADRLSHELARFENITLARAVETRRQRESGAQALRGIKRVITTPSTVALDAAQSGLPTALALSGGGVYDPLPVLAGARDWIEFARCDTAAPRSLDLFRSRVLVEGDGTARIVDRLSRDLARQSPITHG